MPLVGCDLELSELIEYGAGTGIALDLVLVVKRDLKHALLQFPLNRSLTRISRYFVLDATGGSKSLIW